VGEEELQGVGRRSGFIEGVMIGRAAYNDPWGVLGDADRAIFGEPTNPAANRRQAS
jgi:tRNA-dihydrouridine synthase A